MKYLLLMYANDANAPQTEAEMKDLQKEWFAFNAEIGKAGVMLSTGGTQPNSTATTLRIRDGKSMVTDGPFAETHEQLGGYFLLDVENLDEAMTWAAKIPTAKYGSIEIRPLWSPN